MSFAIGASGAEDSCQRAAAETRKFQNMAYDWAYWEAVADAVLAEAAAFINLLYSLHTLLLYLLDQQSWSPGIEDQASWLCVFSYVFVLLMVPGTRNS